MKKQIIVLIAKQFFTKRFLNKGSLLLLFIFVLIKGYVTFDRWQSYENQRHIRKHHQEEDRKSWESNPDKHPHRMAHFGAFAFRLQHPLSIFESGLENYTGNAIFLEAHKQNTANFSEASFSTGLMRFGDLSLAVLLYTILPLFIFFVGYDTISREREDSQLKLMIVQGATIKEVVFGKVLGLFLGACLFFIPAFLTLCAVVFLEESSLNQQVLIRVFLLMLTYTLYFVIMCFFTVFVSAKSKTSNLALLNLLGFWLLFFIVIPKTSQATGNYLFPNPSKLEFRKSIEREVSKVGNSHNPNDPHFNALRDSILAVYKVDDVKKLPFNYGGFVMSKGEQTTAKIYNEHQKQLLLTYQKQNQLSYWLSIVNPHLAIRAISMSLSGTDFNTYSSFLAQAENYRYHLAQHMNKLQMEYIDSKVESSEGKVNVVNKSNWKSFPVFKYHYIAVSDVLKSQVLPIIALGLWGVIVFVVGRCFSKNINII